MTRGPPAEDAMLTIEGEESSVMSTFLLQATMEVIAASSASEGSQWRQVPSEDWGTIEFTPSSDHEKGPNEV
jgi:hypothetical protein